jgi:hypothetical protein
VRPNVISMRGFPAATLRALPNEAGGPENGPHPPAELVIVAATLQLALPSPGHAPASPKHRSAAVMHGQPRFIPMPRRPVASAVRSGGRVLPSSRCFTRGPALPCPAIGPWSRRTGALEGVRDGRDQIPILTNFLTGQTVMPGDERVQDGTL